MLKIRLEEHSPDGTRRALGAALGEETIIGRDPGKGITLDRGSVSRQHGVFIPVDSIWCYRDLGSTNGSWIDGRVIKKDQLVVIRPGDRLQIADTFVVVMAADQVGVRSWDGSQQEGASVVVFENLLPVKVFALQPRLPFSIGGSNPTLNLPGFSSAVPRCIVENKDEDVFLSVWDLRPGDPVSLSVTLNGKQVSGSVRVLDRDTVSCGPYTVVINKPSVSVRPRASTSTSLPPLAGAPLSEAHASLANPRASTTELSPSIAKAVRIGEVDETNIRRRSMSPIATFGQMTEEVTSTSGKQMERMLSGGNPRASSVPPTARHLAGVPGVSAGREVVSAKDRFYVIIGLLTFLVLLAFGLAYVVSGLGLLSTQS